MCTCTRNEDFKILQRSTKGCSWVADAADTFQGKIICPSEPLKIENKEEEKLQLKKLMILESRVLI